MSPVARAARRSEVWSVARQELLDGVRGRRQLVIRAITPVLLFGVVFGATTVTRGVDQTRRTPYRVAVEGDMGSATRTLKELQDAVVRDGSTRLAFEATGDAPLAAANGADVGIRVPDQLDAHLLAHQPVSVEVFQITTSAPSRTATAFLRVAFTDLYQQQLREADAGAERTGLLVYSPVDVQITQAGTRELSAQIVPALLLLQAAMLVSGTATRILGRGNRGLLMAQLLLPLRRVDLARAKAIAELGVGIIASAPVLAVVLGYAGVAGWLRGGVPVALSSFATASVAAVAFALVMVATGLLIGTGAKSQEQVTLGTAIALILTTSVAGLTAFSELPRPHGLAVIPVSGLVSALRDVMTGTGSPGWLAVALSSTIAMAAAITHLAGRVFDADRIVLRVT